MEGVMYIIDVFPTKFGDVMNINEHWLIPSLTFVITFVILSHLLAILDYLEPEWYKNKEISVRPKISLKLYCKIMFRTSINFCIAFVVGHILCYLTIKQPAEFPSLLISLLELIMCYFFAEFYFWLSHYIVHLPTFYKKVHSLHHIFTRPIGLVAIYCTHWEMLIVNFPLASLMPIILKMHPLIHSIWNFGLCFYIVMIHSGHNLLPKWILDSNYHDNHHKYSKGNYGSYTLDKLFLTRIPSDDQNVKI